MNLKRNNGKAVLSAMSFNETDNEVGKFILRTLAGNTLYPLKVNK